VSAPDGEGTKHCRQLETPADNYRHQQTIRDTSRQLQAPADNYRHQQTIRDTSRQLQTPVLREHTQLQHTVYCIFCKTRICRNMRRIT